MSRTSESPRRRSMVERAAERLGALDAHRTEPPPSPRPAAPDGGPDVAVAMRPPPSPDLSRPPRLEIDLDALEARGFVSPTGKRSRLSEEYRQVKRPLVKEAMAGIEPHGNLVMITSAIPGEGKTFTSLNLAMSLTKERDLHVVLVDADLARPSLDKILGAPCDRGLADLLDDPEMDVSEVLHRTTLDTLSVIPAGRPHRMGPELLASNRATAVLNELSRRYPDRLVLFDTSPVLASNEGGALAHQVGQIILVVEAERTTEAEVRSALEILAGCRVRVLLNKMRTRLGSSPNYYGTYYQ